LGVFGCEFDGSRNSIFETRNDSICNSGKYPTRLLDANLCGEVTMEGYPDTDFLPEREGIDQVVVGGGPLDGRIEG